MLRAVVLAARLDLSVDPAVSAAIRRHHGEITHSSPARLVEELYKIARSGASERIIRELGDVGLLTHIAPELHRARSDALWRCLAALDRYQRRFDDRPTTLGNAILLGSIVFPFATIERPRRWAAQEPLAKRPLEVSLGVLPIARRDLERLRQILDLQRRLADEQLSQRARRALVQRSAFTDSLTWMEIHGQTPELVDRWRREADAEAPSPDEEQHRLRRRRRRRRGPRAREQEPESGGRGPGAGDR